MSNDSVRLTPDLAARLAAMLPQAEPATVESIEAAREVLAQLSEHSTDGRLRDMIGEVRYALGEWADGMDAR